MQRLSESGKLIRLSVRDLVEFILRSGSIDNRKSKSGEKDAMQAGSRLHRKIQKRMGLSYQPEVSLKHVIELEEYTLSVEGRADGIITEPEGVTIDEIKGIYADLSYLEEPVMVHMAQAKCYAYIYGIQNQLHQVTVQMTYGNLETEELKRFQEVFTIGELEEWFDELIREYTKWTDYLYRKYLRRKASIERLEFPYEYRAGQKKMAVDVYRTISRKKTLFVQAPTGIGKTMAAIYPTVKAVGEGHGDKIFYLTAKTITRTVAEDSFSLLRKNGLCFSTVTITAKDKLCLMDETDCNPDYCPYANGHYDRVNEAVFDLVHEEEAIGRETILKHAQEYQVCPFEFCLDATSWVDGIICDYNYVFDPNVRLKRYFSEGVRGDYLFLVDEAHNLVSRAREMFSAELYKEDFLAAKKLIKTRSPKLSGKIEKCNKALLMMKRECDTFVVHESISHFTMLLTDLSNELEIFMEDFKEFEGRKIMTEFYLNVWNFLGMYERVDESYQIYTEHTESGKFMLKLLCIHPATNLKECLDKGNSTIFFSATFLPMQYYKDLLRGDAEDYAIYVDSPFDPGNRLLCIGRDVSSKYNRRGRREYEKIIAYIKAAAEAKKGNYIVFFPSYVFMDQVYQLIETMDCGFDVSCQGTQMTETEREEFLLSFETERDRSYVAMCVMGGIFSEGIDLTHERLIGTIIVGTGLPMIGTEGELLRSYYQEKGKNGFEFAYVFPGINKVLQSAGRVIRTDQDRGIILLLDDRFLRPEYQGLFPREWEDYQMITRFDVRQHLDEFWDRISKADQ